jgi:predicted SpoU family rRNA methylase
MRNIRLSSDTMNALRVVLDYVIDSERNHYEEYVSDKFGGQFERIAGRNGKYALNKKVYNRPDVIHVYAYTRRVKDAMG